jgi:hypothetical protein
MRDADAPAAFAVRIAIFVGRDSVLFERDDGMIGVVLV